MKIYKNFIFVLTITLAVFGGSSCKDFFEPEISVVVDEANMWREWSDFRAAEMGLYSLQQDVVEQLVVLGELRADMLEVTEFADPDLIEINNFNFFEGNKYISPVNFYKLIVNSNVLMNKIKERKPLVGNPEAIDAVNGDDDPTNDHIIDNYDKMYGSALCMRAWAYFNAVRIYGKVPYVPNQITDIAQIEEYLNTGQVILSTDTVKYGMDGYYDNDTVAQDTIVLDQIWLNTDAIIDTFTYQLSHNITNSSNGRFITYDVGVNYDLEGVNDVSWWATVWNQDAYQTLLGQMYFTKGDNWRAEEAFNHIVFYKSQNSVLNDRRFMLTFENYSLYFTKGISIYESIYTIPFSRTYKQQNGLQALFQTDYMLKPTDWAVWLYETDWDGWSVSTDAVEGDYLGGYVGDYIRGNGISYIYIKDNRILSDSTVKAQLELKKDNKDFEVDAFMLGVDTLVEKYSYARGIYDRDSYFHVYRAGGVHLWMAELMHRTQDRQDVENNPGNKRTKTSTAQLIISNGKYKEPGETDVYRADALGVRGRVGRDRLPMQPSFLGIVRDPFTNELIRRDNVSGGGAEAREGADRFEDYILEERGRECSFEGERFYDLMRIANRRNRPSFLADRVARKFSSDEKETYRKWVEVGDNNLKGRALIGDKAIRMREHLLNRDNWYVPFYVGTFSAEN